MNSNAPNLFHYAKKELSQDAMICWLIAWAGQEKGTGTEQEELRRCGLKFVSALLNHKRDSKNPVQLEDVLKTEILQQERSIDVLARINERHVLLIEDKTGTGEHGKQLSRYYNDVMEGRTQFGEVLERYLHPVYLKTGNQALADDHRIEQTEKYKVFDRADFLNVLNGYEGSNSILLDFRQHLQEVEDKTNRYTEWTDDERKRKSWSAWEGFYRRLEGELDTSTGSGNGWSNVPNPAGGFLGFYWYPSSNHEIYLQIEGGGPGTAAKLCFKVDAGEDSEQHERLKWDWNKRVLGAGEQQVVKPDVMRKGKSMTVAWWKDDWMAFGKDGKLDVPNTVQNLKRAESVVLEAAISANASGQPSV